MDPLLGKQLGGCGQNGLPHAGIWAVFSRHERISSFGHMTDSFLSIIESLGAMRKGKNLLNLREGCHCIRAYMYIFCMPLQSGCKRATFKKDKSI